jgi:hypothetical protein
VKPSCARTTTSAKPGTYDETSNPPVINLSLDRPGRGDRKLVEPVKQRYLIDGLSMLDARLGSPPWFWPVVTGILFIGLPLLASYVENS